MARFFGQRTIGRRRLIGVGAAGGAAAFLAACGGESRKEEAAPASGAGQTSAAPTAETGRPKPGGALTTRINGNAPLDLVTNSNFRSATIASYVYSRLLKVQTDTDPNTANKLEFVPDLAASQPEITDGGLTYIFKLRPNAKFHNIAPISGRAIASEDIVASIERFRTEPKNQNRGVFAAPQAVIENFETPDPQTVVMKLSRRYSPFLSLFANSYYVYMQPKEVVTGAVDPSKQMIGTGPFMLESYQPDVSFKVKKNPEYFLTGQPYVDSAELVIMIEDVQEVAQLQAGKLDVSTTVPGFPADSVAEFRRTNPRATIVEYLDGLMDYISMQQREGSPFRDERVRRAVTMSVDKQALLDLRFQGKGVWQSAVPAWHARYWLDPQSAEAGPAAQWVKFNPREARALLRAAGQEGLRFTWLYSNNAGYGERFNQAAEAIAGMLKESGFSPQIQTSDYQREYIVAGGVTSGNYQGAFYGLNTRYSDPHEYLFTANYSKSTRNPAGVADPALDALIDREAEELDTPKRIALIKDAQRYIMDKAYYGYGGVGNGYVVVQPWVKNYTRNAGYGQGAEMAANLWMDRS